MRLLLVALLLVLGAVTLAACGGSAEAERTGPPPTIVEAEPAVDQFAGTPLAMVFFHPL